jgi:hypothetical protein
LGGGRHGGIDRREYPVLVILESSMTKSDQIPIWFFIGVLLGVYGVLIFVTGVIRWIRPPAVQLVMDGQHPAVWWGLLLMAIGVFYTARYWPGRRDNAEPKNAGRKINRGGSASLKRASSRRVPARRVRRS